MKHFIALSFLSLMSFSAFANSGASCDLRIEENKVKCPFIGFCPEKTLRESKITVSHLLPSGTVVNEKLILNKVVLFPGTKSQDKHSVYQLPGDDRATKLREEKEVDLVEFASKSEINYTMNSVGDTVHVKFFSGDSSYSFRMTGNFTEKLNGWIFVDVLNEKNQRSKRQVLITCSKTNEVAISESELQKEAVEKYLEEKKKKEEAEAAAANQQ